MFSNLQNSLAYDEFTNKTLIILLNKCTMSSKYKKNNSYKYDYMNEIKQKKKMLSVACIFCFFRWHDDISNSCQGYLIFFLYYSLLFYIFVCNKSLLLLYALKGVLLCFVIRFQQIACNYVGIPKCLFFYMKIVGLYLCIVIYTILTNKLTFKCISIYNDNCLTMLLIFTRFCSFC